MPEGIVEPEEIVEPDDTSMDKTIEVIPRDEEIEEIPRTEPSQDNNIVKSLEEFDRIPAKPRSKIDPGPKQPKKSKGYRDLIAQLRSGYSAGAVRKKVLEDLGQYRELFKVTDTFRVGLKSLVEGEAQAGALEQEEVEVETFPKPVKRLVIQPPRISERRKKQYVRYPDEWGKEGNSQ